MTQKFMFKIILSVWRIKICYNIAKLFDDMTKRVLSSIRFSNETSNIELISITL